MEMEQKVAKGRTKLDGDKVRPRGNWKVEELKKEGEPFRYYNRVKIHQH